MRESGCVYARERESESERVCVCVREGATHLGEARNLGDADVRAIHGEEEERVHRLSHPAQCPFLWPQGILLPLRHHSEGYEVYEAEWLCDLV